MATKNFWCRIGRHEWKAHHNDEVQRYVTCSRCGKDGEKMSLTDSWPPGGGAI